MIHYQDDEVTLHHGDSLDVLAELPDNSVDSVVCDPPYGLDFMGKAWDTGAVAFDTAVWGHALRVLKPGGHCLAFGGSRTWHRLAVAIEDAGFELRDSIAWLYGSGFPKSRRISVDIDRAQGVKRERVELVGGIGSGMGEGRYVGDQGHSSTAPLAGTVANDQPITDAAKQWQGWGTALKPAFEPIVVGRKPIRGTVAANVIEHGTGALNIDACRVEASAVDQQAMQRANSPGSGRFKPSRSQPGAMGRTSAGEPYDPTAGRWPTNVVIDERTAEGIDAQSGVTTSSGGSGAASQRGHFSGWAEDGEAFKRGAITAHMGGVGDTGGASRFFPTFRYEAKAPSSQRPSVNGIAHPTVKPLDLMRWLVRLVTPPHGLVLDPFAGSGTTAEACVHEHMRCITIEREADYLPLIMARLSKPMSVGFDFGSAS